MSECESDFENDSFIKLKKVSLKLPFTVECLAAVDAKKAWILSKANHFKCLCLIGNSGKVLLSLTLSSDVRLITADGTGNCYAVQDNLLFQVDPTGEKKVLLKVDCTSRRIISLSSGKERGGYRIYISFISNDFNKASIEEYSSKGEYLTSLKGLEEWRQTWRPEKEWHFIEFTGCLLHQSTFALTEKYSIPNPKYGKFAILGDKTSYLQTITVVFDRYGNVKRKKTKDERYPYEWYGTSDTQYTIALDLFDNLIYDENSTTLIDVKHNTLCRHSALANSKSKDGLRPADILFDRVVESVITQTPMPCSKGFGDSLWIIQAVEDGNTLDVYSCF